MDRGESLTEAMKIKLIRTGGFIPITKEAETDVNLSDSQVKSLLEIIQPDRIPSPIKDGNYYLLAIGSSSTLVDLEKVPDEYKALFSKLKSDLKFIKRR
jgi:hypothetical protein